MVRRYKFHKEENEENAIQFSRMNKIKEYRQNKLLRPMLSQNIYGLNDILIQYKEKKKKVSKLSIDNKLFKRKTLLEDDQKRVDKNILFNSNSANKALIYLRKLKKEVSMALEYEKRKSKGLSVQYNPKTNQKMTNLMLSTEEENEENESNYQLQNKIRLLLKMIKDENLESLNESKKQKELNTQANLSDNIIKHVTPFIKMTPKTKTNRNSNVISYMKSYTPKYNQMNLKIIADKQKTPPNNLKRKISNINDIITPPTTSSKKNSSMSVFLKSKSSRNTMSSCNEMLNKKKSPVSTFSISYKTNCHNEQILETPKSISPTNSHFNSNKSNSNPAKSNCFELAYRNLLQNNLLSTKKIIMTYLQNLNQQNIITHGNNTISPEKESNPRAIYNQILIVQKKVRDKNIPEKVKSIYNDCHRLNQITEKIVRLTRTERDIYKLNNVFMENMMFGNKYLSLLK